MTKGVSSTMRRRKEFRATKMDFMYRYRTNALYAHVRPEMDITSEAAHKLFSRLARRGFSLIIPSLPTDYV